jgi:2-ketoarginine methyltransferase
MTEAGFEPRLIEALQPIRGFVLAHALHFALHSELWALLGEDETGVAELAAGLGLEPRRLAVLLDYLANEGYVVHGQSGYTLSARGKEIATFAPWYRLLVGGYAATFQSIGETVQADAPYASRDGAAVGEGSCGISVYDAIPLIRSLLGRIPRRVDALTDLGCGDGSVLLALAADVPAAQLTGVDPDPRSTASAKALAAERGIAASFCQADGIGFVRGQPFLSGTACYVVAFVLQEMLEQRGRPAVVDVVRTVLASAADAYLVVVEVEWKIDQPAVMRHGLGLAYYNPYYLVHGLTEQRLESRGFWHAVAADAGGEVIHVGEVDHAVDSTGLEFGLLIGRAR